MPSQKLKSSNSMIKYNIFPKFNTKYSIFTDAVDSNFPIEMLDAIDDFHQKASLPGDIKRDRFIFTMTPYRVEGEKASRSVLIRRTQAARIHALNFIDVLKSVVRRREGNFRSIHYRQISYDGKIWISIANGTATIVRENEVLKFYFKDQKFFGDLHKQLYSLSKYDVEEHADFTLLRMRRLRPIDIDINHADILYGILPKLYEINRLSIFADTSGEVFLPVAKISQLFRLYGCYDQENKKQYTNIAQKLQERAIRLGSSLCHGDLWIENVMQDANGYEIIDYDKAIYFVQIYDYVYFYLVSELSRGRISLEQLVQKFELYVEKVNLFLRSVSNIDLSQASYEKIRACMLLYLLIKLTEKDLRTGRVGGSILQLKKLVKAMSL